MPVDIPGVVRFVAPNLTTILPGYSDAQLVGLLHHRDGKIPIRRAADRSAECDWYRRCHGQDLEGEPAAKAPSLNVAKGYSAEQFARLMKDGTGLGDRTFELMTPTAKARFSHMTADEVDALYALIQSR